MKATTVKFGIITLKNRTEAGAVTAILSSGEEKFLLPAFVKMTDDNGNELIDFSSLPLLVIEKVLKTTKGRKVSKLAEIMGQREERTGERYNMKTKRFEKY